MKDLVQDTIFVFRMITPNGISGKPGILNLGLDGMWGEKKGWLIIRTWLDFLNRYGLASRGLSPHQPIIMEINFKQTTLINLTL